MDSMLIETGGSFGKKENLHRYIDSCVETAIKCIADGESKSNLIKIIDFYITQYKGEIDWKYYNFEMEFLNNLKMRIEYV